MLKSTARRFSIRFFLLAALLVPAIGVVAQSSQDELFNQAVQDYTQNQFTPAQEKFQKVTGAHAQEAQQYLAKIKSYRDAMSAGMSIMDRSSDERDANSLEYAIQKFQEAIRIKSDGPWQPTQQLQKAQQMKADVLKLTAAKTAARARDFCAKAINAQQEHHYRDAALLICSVANDNPAYSCGGDEAVHMCDQMNELAKLDKSGPSVEKPRIEANNPKPAVRDATFEKAKTAFDRNDFPRALTLFHQVNGDGKPAADDYAEKISRYQDAMAQANKSMQDSKYDDAGAAFRTAVNIKADGPGSPQTQALLTELMLGLDQFYSGDYASATQHLEVYAHESSERKPLVHFYLGASKLSRFFLTGSEDTHLQQDALNDLKVAKQAGFKTAGQDVSPKILQAYKELAF